MFTAPFENRRDAGKQLGDALHDYKDKNPVIIGLPRGGVPVAAEVANALNGELTVFVSKKIPAPNNPEFAIGAVSHTGVTTWNEDALTRLPVSESYKEEAREEALETARDKFDRLAASKVDVTGRVVLLVDDGIATGATMKTAVEALQQEDPETLVVAVPFAPRDAADMFDDVVDEYICLEMPRFFQAVGQGYKDFTQVTDEACRDILDEFGSR